MIDQYPSSNGVLTSLIWRKTMSGGETSLSGYDNASQALSYTPGQEQVYLNGILLVRGDDYTATNGTSITGLSALAASDFVQVNCYNNFSVASLPTSGLTGTISNAQLQNSAITINGSAVSLGGSVSLPGDIESVTAGTGLTGGGSSGALTLGLSTPVATTNGGTGLSTFTTGDLVYASGTDTLAKRSIGTTGQVLSVSGGVPTWATPSSGGMTSIASGSLTGSSVVLSSISGSYKNLQLVLRNFTFSGTQNNIKITANSITSYTYQYLYSSTVNTVLNGYDIANAQVYLAANSLLQTTTTPTAIINIFDYADTTAYKLINTVIQGTRHDNSTQMVAQNIGAINSTAAITSLTIGTNGNNFSTGTYTLYGVS